MAEIRHVIGPLNAHLQLRSHTKCLTQKRRQFHFVLTTNILLSSLKPLNGMRTAVLKRKMNTTFQALNLLLFLKTCCLAIFVIFSLNLALKLNSRLPPLLLLAWFVSSLEEAAART